MINLYKALIQPYLNYGIQIWGNSKPTHLQKVIRIQKKAIRTIHGASYNSHTAPLFKNALILEISDLYEFQVLIFMRDYKTNNLPQSFSNLFLQNLDINTSHRTRQSELYYVPKCKNKFAWNLPYSIYPRVWNKWNNHIDISTSKPFFKNSIKKHMLEKYQALIKCKYRNCRDCRKN